MLRWNNHTTEREARSWSTTIHEENVYARWTSLSNEQNRFVSRERRNDVEEINLQWRGKLKDSYFAANQSVSSRQSNYVVITDTQYQQLQKKVQPMKMISNSGYLKRKNFTATSYVNTHSSDDSRKLRRFAKFQK